MTRSSQQDQVEHILVRHEQGAAHAAEGYARSTGKVGVVLVTSGPGATNAVTGLTDALMDSIPIVVHHRPGADASDRHLTPSRNADTVGITRALHRAQSIWCKRRERSRRASCMRPSMSPRPVGRVRWWSTSRRTSSSPRASMPARPTIAAQDLSARSTEGRYERYRGSRRHDGERQAAGVLHRRRRHQFRARPPASCCASWCRLTGCPITSTLMGLGAYPGSDHAMARHARHARHLSRPTSRCTIAT